MPKGWMPGALSIPTQAFGYTDMPPGTMQATAVMSHVMQGYQPTMIQWARERPYVTPKSAHFTIDRLGRIAQHVSVYDPAWAGGYVNRPSWSGLQYPGGGGVRNPNKYVVHIEHEGFSVPPGYGYDYVYDAAHPWPKALVEASTRVHEWVFRMLDIEPGPHTVINHSMVDSVNRANDPGGSWQTNIRLPMIAALKARMAPPATVPAPPPTSGPLQEKDAPVLYRAAYGYLDNGVDVKSLGRGPLGRYYRIILP